MKSALRRELGTFALFSIATGAMISSGIFVLPSVAYNLYGPFVFLSYTISGILALLGLLSFLELVTAMPKAGADYFFTSRTFGPLVGTVSGIFGWIAITLKSAFAIYGLILVVRTFTNVNLVLLGVVFTAIFVIINILGVKEAAGLQILLVVFLVGAMLLHVIGGVSKIEINNFKGVQGFDFIKILQGAAFIFVSYGGLLKSSALAEETRDPHKNLPRALIASIVFCTILYTLYVLVIIGTLQKEILTSTVTPAADSARSIFGKFGYLLIIAASILAFLTTANAGIMSASRYLLALGRDHLLPTIFTHSLPKRGTPYFSIVITGMVIVFSISLLPLDYLVKFASAAILMAYILGSLSVIIFRESKIKSYRPAFRVPLYPYLPIFNIIVFGFLFIENGLESIEVILVVFLISLSIYYWYGRKKTRRDYALLYLMKRILLERDTEGLLEAELAEIIIRKEELPKNTLESILMDAPILDYEKPLHFSEVCSEMIRKLNLDEEEIKEILTNYKPSQFIVTPGFALPHGIVRGERFFVMGIARGKGGIFFDDKRVECCVFIFSSLDMREFYLKFLALIAEALRNKDFWAQWRNAQDTNELRKLILKCFKK